jgi:hypothetical protein
MNEKDAKFFRPLWLRIAITVFVGAWFCWETLYTHESMWMVITAAAFAYCVWNFFLRFPKDQPAASPPTDETPKQ